MGGKSGNVKDELNQKFVDVCSHGTRLSTYEMV